MKLRRGPLRVSVGPWCWGALPPRPPEEEEKTRILNCPLNRGRSIPDGRESLPDRPLSFPDGWESSPDRPPTFPDDRESSPDRPETFPGDRETFPDRPESLPEDRERWRDRPPDLPGPSFPSRDTRNHPAGWFRTGWRTLR